MILPKFNRREKYLVAVFAIYLLLAFSNLKWQYMKAGIEGLLCILMLALPLLIPSVGKIIFKK